MLSRVAENIYWLARYMERADGLARLISATTNTMLDIAPVVKQQVRGWDQLIAITGNAEAFEKGGIPASEREVIDFLAADVSNPGSIAFAIKAARENLRTTREVFPREAWELVNNLYLRSKEMIEGGLSGEKRQAFLDLVTHENLAFTGLLNGTLCNDDELEALRLGQFIERADMLTRIMDVQGSAMVGRMEDAPKPVRNGVWLMLLRSLSGDQIYRRHVSPRMRAQDVLAFLLKDRKFPRAFQFCLTQVERSLTALGGVQDVDDPLHEMGRVLYEADIHGLTESGLHEFLDGLQVRLGELHDRINGRYFNQE
ncbi:alpha-E domain-containing protein [Magnetofaba australis]|uniref:DUF403 domain-containing protein n=1 Tax=Magnetofaba australis IT-1 TaxID=1434232 RepID=A0A1Y2K1W2_9PROT|nr:alpha-E domain-containing protein [Magnetofaba australis]OSM02021.1 hypothetical protein MAIT1_02100 [Magnetofaba australis IT-1]